MSRLNPHFYGPPRAHDLASRLASRLQGSGGPLGGAGRGRPEAPSGAKPARARAIARAKGQPRPGVAPPLPAPGRCRGGLARSPQAPSCGGARRAHPPPPVMALARLPRPPADQPPASSTRVSIRLARCGLGAKRMGSGTAVACHRAPSAVQALGTYNSRASNGRPCAGAEMRQPPFWQGSLRPAVPLYWRALRRSAYLFSEHLSPPRLALPGERPTVSFHRPAGHRGRRPPPRPPARAGGAPPQG